MKHWKLAITIGLGYALLSQTGSSAGILRLKNRAIATNEKGEIASLPASAQPGQHWILQFAGFPNAATRAELERRGAKILEFVPDTALMTTVSRPVSLSGLHVVWVGQLEARDRLGAGLNAAHAFVVVMHRDVKPERAAALLADFQVLDGANLLPNHFLVAANHRALPALAERDEVAFIMPGEAAMAIRRRPYACPGPLTEAGPIGEYALSGAKWGPDSSGAISIGYHLDNLTTKIDPNLLQGQIALAFAQWMKYVPVTLTPIAQTAQPRAVDLLFASGSHGDPYPFDGPGGVLAHTFYPAPMNSEPIAGDMHFDDSENWGVGASAGVDLFSVALHEAGHAIGLAHSTDVNAVMYPYYRFSTGLNSDDITAIQTLYGTSAPTQPSQPAPTQPASPSQPSQPTRPAPSSPTTPSQPSDATPPSLVIQSPGSTIISVAVSSIAFSGTASDNIGVTAVKWGVSTGPSGTAAGTAHWSASVPLLVGSNLVTVRAYDAAGNSGWRAVTVVRTR